MKFSESPIGKGQPDLWSAIWEDITEQDEIKPLHQSGMVTTVQVTGDAAGVEILGVISGKEYAILNDSDTLPLAFSFPAIKTCSDMYQSIKPRKIGAGKATVAMIIRRN